MVEVNIPPETRIYLAGILKEWSEQEPRFAELAEAISGERRVRYIGLVQAEEASLLRIAALRAIRTWKTRRHDLSSKEYPNTFYMNSGVLRALSHLARSLREKASV